MAAPTRPYRRTLDWGQVALVNAGGGSLATAASASSGAIASISGFTLAGQRHVHHPGAGRPSSQASSTGNYVLSVYNVTPNVKTLTLNQPRAGRSTVPTASISGTSPAPSGQQVQLHVINASGGVEFDLTGPGNQVLFSNLTADSSLVTLPASGPYVLTAHGNGGQGGSYAFELEQTSVTSLTLGTPYNGTLAGSGQAQLFTVSVPATQSLFVTLQDDHRDRRRPALRQPRIRHRRLAIMSTPAPAVPRPIRKLLVPSAAPGTWYILVYAASVPSASRFTIQATGAQIQLSGVTPDRSATGNPVTMTFTGSGFDGTTTVELVADRAARPYAASSVSFDTPTQLTATFTLNGVPAGRLLSRRSPRPAA